MKMNNNWFVLLSLIFLLVSCATNDDFNPVNENLPTTEAVLVNNYLVKNKIAQEWTVTSKGKYTKFKFNKMREFVMTFSENNRTDSIIGLYTYDAVDKVLKCGTSAFQLIDIDSEFAVMTSKLPADNALSVRMIPVVEVKP